ncbi:Serine/threonine-protein kinase PAK mbt, partial [Gryllus bimaculatus]
MGGRRVAIKVITLTLNVAADVREEYAVLRRLCSHPNLPDLHGAFLKRGATRREPDQLWFVMELCEGGPITDLVSSLHRQGRRMSEEHIAYVLKEAAKGLWHLHENHVVHRDVKGSNILLTKEGEVKLVDFGLA